MNSYLGIPRWRDLGAFLQGLVLLVPVFYVLQLVLPAEFAGMLYLDRDGLASGDIWRLATYALLHGDVWHLVFNVLVVWFFAPELERALGRSRFILLAVIAAIAGGLAHVAITAAPVIGLSAVVFGILAASAWYWPRRQILLFFVIPVPFYAMVIGLFVIELLMTLQPGSPVAHWAHLGGLVAGLVCAMYWRGRRQRTESGRKKNRLSDRIGFFFWKRKVARRNATQARVDALLEKIGRQGLGALSQQERRFLDRASRTYKTN